MSKDNEVAESQDQDKKDFLDPATTTSIGWIIISEVFKATIAFFTMKGLRYWWKKNYGQEDVGENESYKGISDKESEE